MTKRALTALTALTLLLAAQLVRVFGPMLGWYLRDTVQVGTITLAILAVSPFLLGFLGPLVERGIGRRGLWWVAGLGLVAARLVAQFGPGPGFSLWASIVGLLCFLWLLPMLLGRGRGSFITGLLLGLTLDTAIKGATGTLDLQWIDGLPAAIAMLLICGLTAGLLWWTGREDWTPAFPAASTPLFALGPLLLLNWLVLQNIGWVGTLTGLPGPASLLLILIGDALALQWMGHPPVTLSRRPWMTVGPGVLLLLVSLTADMPGLVFAVAEVVGLLSTGLLLVLIVSPSDPAAASGPRSAALGAGNLLLVILLLLYYVSLDLPLPFGQPEILAGVGFLLLLGSVTALRQPPAPLPADAAALWVTRVVLLVPLVLLAFDLLTSPDEAPADGFPIRVMSYNIHSGYGAEGWHNPEDIARIIEANGAEIVGFQEISRGAVLDASTDLVDWLSRRLEMPYVAFVGTTDPVWGNAILSRYPLADVQRELLPKFDTRIGRGVVAARVDLGQGQSLMFMSTHLHHSHENLTAIHLQQLHSILNLWNGQEQTVLVGDMNASPDTPEMALLLDNGFVDSWAEAGSGDGFTSDSVNPHQRIDWVMHTPDLVATDIVVPASLASDHFPVVTTIDRR